MKAAHPELTGSQHVRSHMSEINEKKRFGQSDRSPCLQGVRKCAWYVELSTLSNIFSFHVCKFKSENVFSKKRFSTARRIFEVTKNIIYKNLIFRNVFFV